MRLPLKVERHAHSPKFATLKLLKRFEFESQLLRSGVLAVDSTGSADEAVVFVRGDPGSIEQVIGKDQVPADYRQAWLLLPI